MAFIIACHLCFFKAPAVRLGIAEGAGRVEELKTGAPSSPQQDSIKHQSAEASSSSSFTTDQHPSFLPLSPTFALDSHGAQRDPTTISAYPV
ncbi:hypothetical protein BC829DRAFT_440716 [Chytridium lagenaria]|nr:hypothetical protein BC829DRAFT_440716 [Chytridium lagenaria]